ncbi:sensor histidine kinase [Caenimonas terrae]|uniref:histidine kinase n=1 Tax=Caenimonas terrae TaxID=696074 RepID=A0ABW0NIQ8_9BURK
MTSKNGNQPASPPALLGWLARVNTEVSQWAASMSWWRLIVLFFVVLIASSIIGDLLHLKHDRVRVAGPHKDVNVTIGGPNGIRIRTAPQPPVPPVPPGTAAAPAEPAQDGAAAGDSSEVQKAVEKAVEKAERAAEKAAAKADSAVESSDLVTELDDQDRPVSRRVVTVRGVLGDLGGAVMVILFAYLAAAKIVVRKVAQADAKVRTAVDVAEREVMERQLVQARLQVLQAQVEPHFLFNTLAAVDYLIETEPPRASRMQKALITYLRGALPQMRQESSTLGREIKLVSSYLELIKMRIEERLEVEFAIPETLNNAEFPPMMLQSLVENAIKHGIEPKPEGGKVRISAGVQGTQLWVEVGDTGVGLPDGEFLEGPTSGTGLGLQNIRERLAMLYPGKSRLMLRSDAATGTVVRITVPYQVSPEAPPPARNMREQGNPA